MSNASMIPDKSYMDRIKQLLQPGSGYILVLKDHLYDRQGITTMSANFDLRVMYGLFVIHIKDDAELMLFKIAYGEEIWVTEKV